MSWNELLAAVLTIVIGYLLKLGLAYIHVEIDQATFNAIVTGIVSVLLALLGVQFLKSRGVRGLR